MNKIPYCCVDCAAALISPTSQTLSCGQCGKTFPVLGSIPILVSRPDARLSLLGRMIGEAAKQRDELAKRLEEDLQFNRVSAHAEERRRRQISGMTTNLELYKSCVGHFLHTTDGANAAQRSLLDTIAVEGTEYPIGRLLPYFHQDWCGTPRFAEVSELVQKSVSQYSPDRQSIAVLGAAACGLVKTLAPIFEASCFVDLSLITLLIADRVLSGEEVRMCLPSASWHPITISNPTPRNASARLLVADVTRLPLADQSQSVVLTQYVTDLVGDALNLASEIHRVLKCDGIWVNFSPPFSMNDEPAESDRPRLDEVVELLRDLDFEMLEASVRRFTNCELAMIDDYTTQRESPVQFYVARRRHSARNANIRHSCGKTLDAAWWSRVPRVARSRAPYALRREDLTGKNAKARLMGIFFGMQWPVLATPAECAGIHSLLSAVDGRRSLKEIHETVSYDGARLSESDFAELIGYLVDRNAVLVLQ